jgi:uncharacterized protein
MSLLFNIRHLEKQQTLSLSGELTPAELELESLDELVKAKLPLRYELEVQELDNSILVQGSLRLTLHCECARCLKPFTHELILDDWACHLPLEGEEKVPISNDSVDLTPYLREDILLAFPQRPLCEPECGGLPSPLRNAASDPGVVPKSMETSSAWAELDKLKLKLK